MDNSKVDSSKVNSSKVDSSKVDGPKVESVRDHAKSIVRFNGLAAADARTELIGCCQCGRWAETVAAARPYNDLLQLMSLSRDAWAKSTESEILEAFKGHPQIGDLQALRNKYKDTATAEQGQISEANESTLLRLRDQNIAYREKFGFIFIVCATGKSAQEMLELLEARINNSRATELVNGAAEQMKITEIRLNNLLSK